MSKVTFKSRLVGLDFADEYVRQFNTYVTSLRQYNSLLEQRLVSKRKDNSDLEKEIYWAKHIALISLEGMCKTLEKITSN